jgi:hypothetical protein
MPHSSYEIHVSAIEEAFIIYRTESIAVLKMMSNGRSISEDFHVPSNERFYTNEHLGSTTLGFWLFNNYSPKAKWLPANIHRDEVEVNIPLSHWAWGE